MLKKLLVTSLGLALSLPVAAMNWGFLEDAPAGHFTDGDWSLMGKTTQEALDQAADGDTRGWNNTKTGAFGTIQPLNTYDRDGVTCRLTEIFNSAKGAIGTSRFDFCKQPDGSWKVAPRRPPEASAPKE